ncbi:riboflavin biosynthesis protein [Sulfurimicrobium lacus]|uniref:Riboflavin biosynthesis protein n=1 Tax=Sulfurimicrobium lacus TaxID=2715678 RepID=A0A6F8VA22_9PROT|nr:bifunctional riboflavin kinase/FAD synthetase [Sulfurimicrobium lacus]BCB25822.1 riboflavin biosynthesis protein [Sulfurimicrobium lacus]
MLIFRGIPASETPIALTIGNFDGVHLGHQAMLERMEEAARKRGLPACVMTFEPHPREFFTPDQAPTRLTSLREKLQLFAEYGVDRVFICPFNKRFASIDAGEFVTEMLHHRLQTRWALIGDDFRFGAKRAGDFDLLQASGARLGFEVESMHSVMAAGLRVSSTAVREALAGGDLDLARALLGRPYSISGRVEHGESLGHKIGFPTANIQLKHNRPPLWGIFAVEVEGLGDQALQGAASLGVRPTVMNNGLPTLEVHLFNFDQQIYNRHVRVDFLHKLRDEMKFPNLETLTAQIAADVANAKRYFGTR